LVKHNYKQKSEVSEVSFVKAGYLSFARKSDWYSGVEDCYLQILSLHIVHLSASVKVRDTADIIHI
jgi:hypothetical protein